MSFVTFAACTGRGRVGAYTALGEVGTRLRQSEAPGVYLNGLIVYGHGGLLLRDMALPADVVRDAVAFASEQDVSVVGFSGDRSLCAKKCQWTQVLADANDPDPEVCGDWSMITAEHRLNKLLLLADAERVDEIRPKLLARLGDAASLTQATPTMLEVLPSGASKGDGVALLASHLEVEPAEIMALGDAENDIGMLQLAGHSVAMGQAKEDVKAAAVHVTGTNVEDGAADAIERLFLEPRGVMRGGAYASYCGDGVAPIKK